MKILLVTETIPGPQLGGLAKHVVALGNALISQGHHVVLMGRNTPSYESCAEEIGFKGLFVPGFSDPFKGWKEKKLGVFIPGKRSWYARKMAQGIISYAQKFDVIHYHGLHPMVGRFIPKSIPFLQTRHDQGSDCIVYTRFRRGMVCTSSNCFTCSGCAHETPGWFRRAISGAAAFEMRHSVKLAFDRHPVVFVSNFLESNYRRLNENKIKAKTFVIHNSVDDDRLRFLAKKASAKTASSANFIVHVAARLDVSKGVGALLDVLAPRMPKDWILNIFGDGPEYKSLSSRFSSNQIFFRGHQRNDEVLLSAAKSHAAVVPSLWEEPFGVATLEVLRLGLPCFALNRGGTPELAAYGRPGQLKLFDSMDSLVDALLDRSELGASSDIPVPVNDWVGQILTVYRQVIK